VNSDLEVGLEPLSKFFDKRLAEIAPMSRPFFLERVVQVLLRDVRDVDGVSAKVEEVMGD
jgi:hypothetical protein